jgi:hypothetical protein
MLRRNGERALFAIYRTACASLLRRSDQSDIALRWFERSGAGECAVARASDVRVRASSVIAEARIKAHAAAADLLETLKARMRRFMTTYSSH